MLVKSKNSSNYVNDLKVTFGVLHRYKVKLNQFKCTLGVGYGKFLGYMVNQRGIKANS